MLKIPVLFAKINRACRGLRFVKWIFLANLQNFSFDVFHSILEINLFLLIEQYLLQLANFLSILVLLFWFDGDVRRQLRLRPIFCVGICLKPGKYTRGWLTLERFCLYLNPFLRPISLNLCWLSEYVKSIDNHLWFAPQLTLWSFFYRLLYSLDFGGL